MMSVHSIPRSNVLEIFIQIYTLHLWCDQHFNLFLWRVCRNFHVYLLKSKSNLKKAYKIFSLKIVTRGNTISVEQLSYFFSVLYLINLKQFL